MKKHVLIFLFLVTSFVSGAQITGTKLIPGDFPSIEAAISAINNQDIGPGGVTFLVAAGHSEIFSTPQAGLITNSGTESNPIVFQKSGEGPDPVITAATPGSGAMDFIIGFSGSDYVTFDGIGLRENSANTTPNAQMEWGFAILKASPANGSQHITIRNASINLNRDNSSTYAIYSANHTVASTEQLSLTGPEGTNSHNRYYGLLISNVYNAIYLCGANDVAPYSLYDFGNEIGVEGEIHIDGLGCPQGSSATYGIKCQYQDNLIVANTTFSGSVGNSTGPLYVMHLSAGTNSSAEVYNNTISMTYLGTGSFYGIYNSGMGASGSSNEMKLHNNNIVNNAIPNYSSATLAYMYISTGAVSTQLYENLISGNTAGSNMAAASGTIYYIYCNSTPAIPGTSGVYQNSISDNSRIQASPAGGVTYVIYTGGNGNVLNVAENSVSNISLSSMGTSFVMYNLFSGIVKNVHHNQISGINQVKGIVYGMYNGNGSGAGYHYNNSIRDINMTSVSGKIYGIYQSSGLNQFYYNNFISELKAPFANSNPAIYGIYLAGTAATGAYNNTVYLDAVSNGANFGVTGVYASTTPQVELINNIIINNSIPGPGGRVVVYQRSSALLTSYALTSDHNDFYISEPGPSRLYFYDGSNADQDLAALKARLSPREASSISEKPPFINILTPPYDLHIADSYPTQCESGGSIVENPVFIQYDFDDDTRFPGEGYPMHEGVPVNAPDIGADEFAGILNDKTPPAISFRPLLNTSATGNRSLTITINDATGVPVDGPGMPMLYWRINNGIYNAVSSSWSGGHTYTFTFGSGVSLGDVVSYYVVARDSAEPVPNIGAYPPGGAGQFAFDPPSCAIPPSSPNSYIIIENLAGVYPVGAGQIYPTLSAAISDLNLKELTAPVTFELWDTLYANLETFPLVIHACAGMSDVNTLTIRPKAGVNSKIRGSSSTGILSLYGASNVILDGSDFSTPGNHLTFENTGNAANSYVVGLFHDGLNAAISNRITHCVVKAGSRTGNTSAILLNSQGGDYDNTIIENNLILNATTGIQFSGTTIRMSDNGRILNNILGSEDDNVTLGNTGISVSHASGLQISGNLIHNLFTNTNPKGIVLGINTIGANITENTIRGIKYAGTAGYGGIGIDVNTGCSASNLVISNNVLTDIAGDGSYEFGAGAISGIRLLGTSGGINIWFNTISLEGDISRQDATADVSAALYIGATVTDLDIRNNILKNSLENTSGIATAYAIYSDAPAQAFTKLNHNDYFGTGAEGRLGHINDTDILNLESWQSATSKDMDSRELDPAFIVTQEFVPSNPGIDNQGQYLNQFKFDKSGALRTSPPDPGAFEFGPNPDLLSMEANAITCQGARLNAVILPNEFTAELYFDYGLDAEYGYSVQAAPDTFNGTDTVFASAEVSLPSGSDFHYRARVVTSLGVTVFSQDMTFSTPPPGVPTVSTQPASEIGTYQANLNAWAAAACLPTQVYFEYGPTSDYGFTVAAIQDSIDGGYPLALLGQLSGLESNTVYHYRCVAVNEAGVSYGSDEEFTTLLPAPPEAGEISGPASVCQGSSDHVYYIDPIDYAEQYIWTLPPGAEITGGEYTESITVSFSETSVSGHVSVYGAGEGGTGSPSQLYVSVNPRPEPVVNGAGTCCYLSVYTYSTDTGMTAYDWNLSPGGEILTGEGTHTVSVIWNDTGSHWIAASYTNENNCDPVSPAVKEVTVSDLPVPVISGSDIVCQNNGLNIYSAQEGYNSYTWEVSPGGMIVSGQGSHQVEISWEQSGNNSVSVNYANEAGCFATTPVYFYVSVLEEPSAPGQISGTGKICANSAGISYTVDPVPGALSYLWSLPEGAFIVEGEGTNSILVDFSMFAQSGQITVMGANVCGISQPSAPYIVDVTPMPPSPEVMLTDAFMLHSNVVEGNQWYRDGNLIEGATGQFYQPEESGFYWTVVTQNGCESFQSNHVEVIFTGMSEENDNGIVIYPVPNSGRFNIRFDMAIEEQITVLVYNSLGMIVYEERDIRVKEKAQLSVDLRNPPSGIYTTVLKWRDRNVIRKILVVQ